MWIDLIFLFYYTCTLKNHAQVLIFCRLQIAAYTKDYTAQVLLGYIATYIFMQTFMIPGTIFFSLLAGALFGTLKGLILVVFSATVGASSCFFLSKLFARPLVFWLWPEKLRFFRAKVWNEPSIWVYISSLIYFCRS